MAWIRSISSLFDWANMPADSRMAVARIIAFFIAVVLMINSLFYKLSFLSKQISLIVCEYAHDLDS
jgi:hypothetical protein